MDIVAIYLKRMELQELLFCRWYEEDEAVWITLSAVGSSRRVDVQRYEVVGGGMFWSDSSANNQVHF